MLINEASTDRPEHELLVCCARTEADATVSSRARVLLSEKIDWEYLFQLARRHSVVPLVYTQLQTLAAELVPPEWMAQFKTSYQENVARNLVLTSELNALIRALNDAGIESIPFKGPVLAVLAYENLALRRFVDLDIIVKRDDVLLARDVLLNAGYECVLNVDQQTLLLQTQHNIQFKRDNGRTIVELHWEVASDLFARAVSADELWERLIQIDLNGETVNSMSVDDLMFSLCVHGSRHIWERLSWVCDIAELISRRKIDWPSLIDRARSTDCERMFYLGLFLADRLFDINVPLEIRSKLTTDTQLQKIAEVIIPRLFSGTTHVPASPSQIFRFNFNLRTSWRGRARYFAFMLRPTDRDLGIHLPRPLSFAYYLIRPVRLLMFDKR
ncbi:MAG TPA: nucleotidyltransferase family protein [Pyrinomonadaceae bacterium]|nr:nucleotidyltransferase family protein [Pyrinomonadaceae bacterium]